MASPKFNRLIRFVRASSTTHFGELPEDHPWDKPLEGIQVALYDGESPWDDNLKLSGKTAVVKEVLCPLADVFFIYGVGLNYKKHAEESGTFVKYPDAIAGPYEDVPMPPAAVEVDYEGEFVFVMGKDVKNIAPGTNALDYVLGYTIGNDLSSRIWRDPKRGTGGQSNYAKSFDKFAPLGPVLVSSKLIPDPSKLTLRTWVNGEKRQQSGIDDLIFDVSQIIQYLSQGRRMRKGSVVMTGTPSGVGSFLKSGPKFLQDGDVVEIEIDQIGRIRNKMVSEK